MEEKFDIKELQKRITEVKEETKMLNTFTREYLECLIERHDLPNFMEDDYEFEDIPEEIISIIKKGELPTEEQISELDEETQDIFIKECVFLCGISAVSWYCDMEEEIEEEEEDDEEDVSIFEIIMEMSNESIGHYTATYIIAALTLLFGKIPSFGLIECMTNNFSSDDEQIDKNMMMFNELCFSIICRYKEDKSYYDNKNKEGI